MIRSHFVLTGNRVAVDEVRQGSTETCQDHGCRSLFQVDRIGTAETDTSNEKLVLREHTFGEMSYVDEDSSNENEQCMWK